MTPSPDAPLTPHAPGTRGTPAPHFEVLVVGASAGGLPVLAKLLRGLPSECDLPIVVMMHLPPDSALDQYLSRSTRSVEWIKADGRLKPAHLLLCPPRTCVELFPDGRFHVVPSPNGARDHPIDRLFDSVARSHGPKALGIILTGMGRDGARGAGAIRAAGGQVIVQNPASAEYPDMPMAAIDAGAASLVVPEADLGQVIDELVSGTPRPRARSEVQSIARVFGHRGEMSRVALRQDWSQTSIGPVLEWPAALRFSVSTAMQSPHPTVICWGAALLQVCNDAWHEFMGGGSAATLGEPLQHSWAAAWPALLPLAERVLRQEEAAVEENARIFVQRAGRDEEVYASLSCTPIRDLAGDCVGVQLTTWQTTPTVLADRRLRTLRDLSTRAAGASSLREACTQACPALAANHRDLPFALIYLVGDGNQRALLACAAGVAAGGAVAPHVLHMADDAAVWPIGAVLPSVHHLPLSRLLVDDLSRRFPDLAGVLDLPDGLDVPTSAVIVPLRAITGRRPVGLFIAALSPHCPFDADYSSFIEVLAEQISAELGHARARELERERAERLAEVDSAKTEFFANVSHEFRTPLTLLLAPLDEIVQQRQLLPARLGSAVEVAARNARRLLRLVNDLLDFSESDVRHQRAALEDTDLATLTRNIVGAFESAFSMAAVGIRLNISPDLPAAIPANADMWEKVVSNLLSNALKFTFEGQVEVSLNTLARHAELVVADSGVGIPKDELGNVFKRFHRVRGMRTRTVEGSGVGLSIVHDLVQRMGGQVTVHSIPARGTTFTVWLPLQTSAQHPGPSGAAPVTRTGTAGSLAAELVNEATGWMSPAAPEDPTNPDAAAEPRDAPQDTGGVVLVVDNNADVREYLARLLGARWDVHVAADGVQAMVQARRTQPDLILADVMMPNLGGFGLIESLRQDDRLKSVPVLLVTAQAGEDAAIAGLQAGAHDVIPKPFSARELVARVEAAVSHAKNAEALRSSETRLNAQQAAFRALLGGTPVASALALLTDAAVLHERAGTACAVFAPDAATGVLTRLAGTHGTPPALRPGAQDAGTWSCPLVDPAGRVVGRFALFLPDPGPGLPRDLDAAMSMARAATVLMSSRAAPA